MMLASNYNQAMEVEALHNWQVTKAEAREIQHRLASMVSTKNEVTEPRYIAGVDISQQTAQGIATGVVVVLNYPQLRVLEVKIAKQKVSFPYIPGLLSFREAPLIIAAFEKITIAPELILVDGQGIAHPRRLGLASHLGLLIGVPTIGCAKSRLCGSHEPVGMVRGSFTELRDGDEVIGAALRTKDRTNPLYISIGHKVDLDTAIFWVMECCRGYRIPEPTRLAHLAAAGHLEEAYSTI